ncbi:hypothetical protein LPJ59_001814 [Coemansia sp. RSA 2399]|nr:hypothetical protein LPJ59_001814 [Coemansia sp. RSA 2399]KAJ1906122.1 hypothetical protein LPJ81_001522 [Coemansia sp. IMI 209127]
MENGPMLTRIGCIFTSKNELFPHLIEKSAPILESLEFKDEALLNVKALIFDDKGQPMVYPRLRRLDVSTGNTLMPGDRLCVDKRIAPFPNLRYLRWHSIYAFEDDTLFRGNSGTLECMDILVDTNLADTLQRRKVFADCKYSQLCNVSVGIIDANDTIPLELDTFIRLSVNFVVPATKSFTLDFVDLSDIAGLVAESQHLGNIQHLNLTGYTGRLQHLLTIVKLMPSMTKLTCRRDINELGPGNLDLGSFIDGLYIMYYPLSHRLRYWEVLVGSDNEIENIAASALALAALCTDFVLAYVPLRYREAFGHRIKEAIESGLYDKYLDKIQRLLRIMD